MGNILYYYEDIFEAITIFLNITFVLPTPNVQRFSIGTAQLFFCSFIILSRNDSFTYAVLVSSTVNESYCICREIIYYYFDHRTPFLNCHLRNYMKKLFLRNSILRDVFYIFKIVWNLGGTRNLCFHYGNFCMQISSFQISNLVSKISN